MQLEETIAKELAGIIKEHFSAFRAEVKAIDARLSAVEVREPEKGERGEKGDSITGPVGPKGDSGADGIAGPVGPVGPAGSSFLIGKGPPHEKLDGHAYLDSDTGDLYEFKS